MGEVVQLNTIGHPHVVCAVCDKPYFWIKTEGAKFYSIVCCECGNEIFCNLQAVFGPVSEKE